jgi:hypothetical protein
MVHEGAPEPLLRTPSSRTGSGGMPSKLRRSATCATFEIQVQGTRHYVPTNRQEAHLRLVQQRMQ